MELHHCDSLNCKGNLGFSNQFNVGSEPSDAVPQGPQHVPDQQAPVDQPVTSSVPPAAPHRTRPTQTRK